MSFSAMHRLEALLQSRKLDTALARRFPGDGRGVLPTGCAPLDARLGGGWPHGELSELIGRPSSGRTSLLMTTLAAATRGGGLVGLVDAFDRLDPRTAVRAGLDLDRVLWVRGSALSEAGERASGRAGERGSGRVHAPTSHLAARAMLNAIRALDLIVRAGGFAVAALDLGEAPRRAMVALPFTTWLRLAHANEGRETVCLLLGEAPMGRSARGCSVRIESRRCWAGAHAQSHRFVGFDVHVSGARDPGLGTRPSPCQAPSA